MDKGVCVNCGDGRKAPHIIIWSKMGHHVADEEDNFRGD